MKFTFVVLSSGICSVMKILFLKSKTGNIFLNVSVCLLQATIRLLRRQYDLGEIKINNQTSFLITKLKIIIEKPQIWKTYKKPKTLYVSILIPKIQKNIEFMQVTLSSLNLILLPGSCNSKMFKTDSFYENK